MKNTLKKLFGMSNNETTMATDEMVETMENESIPSEYASNGDQSAARIEELEGQLKESKDKYLRLFAEFDNAKRRAARENLEIRQTAGREILAALIPILDDFDRAASLGNLGEGVQLIHQKLQSTVTSRGLRAMESTGLEFDADRHEAITEIPAPTDELRGKVIDTVEKGYLLGDKIIRFAKVVVGK